MASPDLLARDATAPEPGQRLVGDITALRTGEGWPCPATVIDLATRAAVGGQLAEHMRTGLVTDALAMAVAAGPAPPGAVFPSDRGCQCASAEFARSCTGNRVQPGVGRTGACWDTAAAESFFATLKNETHRRQRFDTRAKARFAVAEYVEIFCNRKRRHSSLGYRPPAEAHADHQARAAA